MNIVEAALKKINTFESKLKKVRLDAASDFQANLNGNLNFVLDGQSYGAKLNRAVIHQLSSRIWEEEQNDYDKLINNWNIEIKKDKLALENKIKESLKRKQSILLLDKGKMNLYGIISPNFTEIDPLEFRTEFLNNYHSLGKPDDQVKRISRTRFGEIVENFTFKQPEVKKLREPVKLDIGLIYGLNNGYSSFRIRITRTILVCENGLTTVESRKLAQLKHTKYANIPNFVRQVKQNMDTYSDHFQRVIDNAKNRPIYKNEFDELFQRLHVSEVVKGRVKERFEIEKNNSGNNEWALSQSFTNLATHFYKRGHHEKILTEVGSDILDNSINHVLSMPIRLDYYGNNKTYKSMLPKDYGLN